MPQILYVTLPPGGETETSVFWHSGTGVASGNAPFTWHGILPATGGGLSVSALKGCSSAPLAFLFRYAGSSRSPELLRCLRNSLWSGGLVQFVTLPGLSLVLQNLLGVFVEPLRTYELCCPASGCSLHPRLCLSWASWVFPCYVFSWLSSLALGCGVLYFRHGFCDEHSGPSLAPLFAGLTVPAQPTRDNRNGRLIFCAGGQGYLVHFGFASSSM